MNLTIAAFVAGAVLLVVGAALREFQVPASGTRGRGDLAHRVTILVAACTVVAACLTVQRLAVMAL
ncbi:hypothetical protein [Gordonia polyisoprenivorans]|uniref:hypothetical protein n=1 Tax=Gordonia polyisoprenivorans TaxID=84595 RepID=UPI0023009032|nr:hypothetical protein [Gordonia polyisoprenivorans]WCB39679.1 hypothetical protein PHA63_11510 [Gordonia polyisoprenivorans]